MKSTRIFKHTSLLVPLLFCGSAGLAAQLSPAVPTSALSGIQWQDLRGKRFDAHSLGAHKATVFLFGSTQCPISNLYTRRMNQLAREFTPLGAAFFFVDANPEDTSAALASYAKRRTLTPAVVRDPAGKIADALAADRTPEAIVLDSAGLVKYRGRIDDNQDPELVRRHDLREALEAVLAGRPVVHSRTLAFGCIIARGEVAVQRTSGPVVFTRDIAPILNANCVSCHRAGGSAPFSLETYQQARIWASQMREYTSRRLMPPWKAVAGYGDFHDSRSLDDRSIGRIAAWAAAGAPEGDPKLLPPTPHFESGVRWALGTPDLVLRPSRAYHLAPEGRDVYRQFVLPNTYSEDRFINGFEFHPQNKAVVHHIIVYFDPTGETAKLDGRESEPGYTVPGAGIVPPDVRWGSKVQWISGWAAGNTPRMLPAGTAFRLPAHSRFVMQVHYHKDGQVEPDQSEVGIHFVDPLRVEREMHVYAVINSKFDLKPGVANQVVEKEDELPFDSHVWAVFPHMHLLGREMKLDAVLPDGKTLPMIWINDWDFNWQETYAYRKPLALPAHTRIRLRAVYDNSERNPRQPTHPPREVFWGEQTTDEMCIGFFQFTVDAEHLHLKSGPPARVAARRAEDAQ